MNDYTMSPEFLRGRKYGWLEAVNILRAISCATPAEDRLIKDATLHMLQVLMERIAKPPAETPGGEG